MIDFLKIYKSTLRIRMVEEAIANRYQVNGKEQKMRCPIHLSIGQEILATSICDNLKVSDKLFSTHRCHAHYLAKGGSLKRMLAEIHGKQTGCTGGRGGSMHLTDPEVGMILSVPIVASVIPLAVGSALADKINRCKDISVVIFGDACLEEGVLHASMNFASINKLPVLFICENNLYSVYTNIADRQPKRPLINLGIMHSIDSYECDGNEIDSLFNQSKSCINNIRNGLGPSLMVINTYRWLEHCGPNYDNHIGYRSESEFIEWQKKDGLKKLEIDLLKNGLIDEQILINIIKELSIEIDEAFKFAENSPYPSSEDASNFIYA